MLLTFRALLDLGVKFMGNAFWIRRFFAVFAIAFAIISSVQMLKGRGVTYSIAQASLWGLASSFLFTVSRYFRSRAGQKCAICKDTPETRP